VARGSSPAVKRRCRVPDALPPPIAWRAELAARLSEAMREEYYARLLAVNKLAERLGVAFTTAQRPIDRLASEGILAGPTRSASFTAALR